jgi:5-methylcytosine-specific restriction endonuclease McrA
MPKKKQTLKRGGVYPVAAILPLIVMPEEARKKKSRTSAEFEGKQVYLDSARYQMFASKGTICVACGLKGAFFALEQHYSGNNPERWHFNLYGKDVDGNEVLLTKDHIKPKSRKGKNHLDNYQPMCYPCNQAKGNGSNRQKKPTMRMIRRITRLLGRIGVLQQQLKEQRKQVYDPSHPLGGVDYLALKKRSKILFNRFESLRLHRALLKKKPG